MTKNPNNLFKVWDLVILGKKKSKELYRGSRDTNSIKENLYTRTLETMPNILKSVGISDLPSTTSIDLVKAIFNSIVEIPPDQNSFFPKRIIETKSANCAGNTLIANSLFAQHKLKFDYGRPEGHSMNLVYIDEKTWWVDGADAVMDIVEIKDRVVNGVRVGKVKTNNAKIPHKLIRLLKPRDIILNIFGNILALQSRAEAGIDKDAIEIMENDGKLIKRVDWEKWMFYLYDDYMKYTITNKEFQKESKRIKEL